MNTGVLALRVCTCVCIYIYVCLFMYACMHACMYVCMYVCVYACMFIKQTNIQITNHKDRSTDFISYVDIF